jgi:hypothetical protein
MPWLSAMYPERNYMFQQYSKPAHTANSMLRFLGNNMAV